MKNTLVALACLSTSPAFAGEEEGSFRYGAAAGFFLGYPFHDHDEGHGEQEEAAHHEHRNKDSDFRFALDVHGDFVALISKEGELFSWQSHFGANIGFLFEAPGLELEIKPLGLHLDCDDGPCRPAYSFESIADGENFGAGLVFGLAPEKTKIVRLTEVKIPLRYKSFFISPYYHAHEGEKDFGVQAGFYVPIKGQLGLAPSISVQKDAAWFSLRVVVGHFHPY